MEDLLLNVNWLAVVVGAIAAYALGALWYSEKLFARKWKEGIGTPAVPNQSMMHAMFSQAVGTFMLAWVIGITETTNALWFAILITLTLAALIKANGLFAGKTKTAIMIETSFVIAMVVVMILAQALL